MPPLQLQRQSTRCASTPATASVYPLCLCSSYSVSLSVVPVCSSYIVSLSVVPVCSSYSVSLSVLVLLSNPQHDCFLRTMARNRSIFFGEYARAKLLRNDEFEGGFEEIREARIFLLWMMTVEFKNLGFSHGIPQLFCQQSTSDTLTKSLHCFHVGATLAP